MKKTLLLLLTFSLVLSVYAWPKRSTENDTVYKFYIQAQEALAADDYEIAKTAIENLKSNSEGDLKKLSEDAAASGDIESLREAFKPLSEFLSDKEIPEGLIRVYCPMVKSYWLQKKGDISNPYFGASMPSCGIIKFK